MYYDEYENRGFPIVGYVVKILLSIVLFLFLSFIISKINNTFNSQSTNIIPAHNELFFKDRDIIKNAVINYYTSTKLPTTVSESETLSFRELIDRKLINNIEGIDIDKSYITISNIDNDYLLKINFNNYEEDDYYLYHLGSYSYCETYICDKKIDYELINYGVRTVTPFNNNEAPKPVEPVPEAITDIFCKSIDGKFYDNKAKSVSEVDYIAKCIKPHCQKINEYYFGKNGNSISGSRFIKECKDTFKCIEIDGKYYDNDGKKVSKATFNKTCTNNKNNYEYTKTSDISFSEWSNWSSWERVDCSTKEITCDNDDSNCTFKLQKLVKKEKNGIYQKTYTKKRKILVKTGSYKKKACNNYNYVKIDNKIYAIPLKSNFEGFNDLDKTIYNLDWIYEGTMYTDNLKKNDISSYYAFVNADFTYCKETCSNSLRFVYDSFKYVGGIAEVDSLTTSSDVNGVLLSEVHSDGQTRKFANSCGGYKEKNINIYKFVQITDTAYRDEPLYSDVCYKSTKTRDIIESGSTKTIWSFKNDSKLLNDGWVMTGRVKKK